MNAEKNPILQQASNDLYTINADEIFRQQARARADLTEKDKEIELLKAQLATYNK